MKNLLSGLLLSCLFVSQVSAYTIEITEPEKSRAYHRFAQSIDVQTKVRPNLQEGYTTAVLLNDKVVIDGNQGSIATNDLVAGEYVISAIIMDKNAKTVAKDSKTVYIIQNNAWHKKKQAAINERKAYDELPLYKKLAIGINPKKQAPPKVNQSTPTWEIQQRQMGLTK